VPDLALALRKVRRSMARFEAKTSTAADGLVVALAGECDLSVREEVTSVLLAAVGSAPVVMVDLSALSFLDSSGVHALVAAYHAARDGQGRIYVVNAGGVVAEVLELTGVGELLRPPAGDDHDG
jgi:anti-sigma B factor antagonist